jgi:hypothetical protein
MSEQYHTDEAVLTGDNTRILFVIAVARATLYLCL